MKKLSFILLFIGCCTFCFSQQKDKIHFSNVSGNEIKLSHIYDTSIKVVIPNPNNLNCYSSVIIHGNGFNNVVMMQLSQASNPFNFCSTEIRKKIMPGTKITLQCNTCYYKGVLKKVTNNWATYTIVKD